MSRRQADLFAAVEMGDDSERHWLHSLSESDRVWWDYMQEKCIKLEVLTDRQAELERIFRARPHLEVLDHSSWLHPSKRQRRQWVRPVRDSDPFETHIGPGRRFVHVALERTKESQLGAYAGSIPKTLENTDRKQRLMTDAERDLAVALGHCRFAPATWDKRFARDMAARAMEMHPAITKRQAEQLARLGNRYRKQLQAMGALPRVG